MFKDTSLVIKQHPHSLIITNPGGFPLGVNLNNLLTVNSTPRNRLMADVLAKTGMVERSGQGIDKIFFQSIAEAKGSPDYTHSDDFQVELRLSAIVKDKAFALFIKQLQKDRKENEKLSVAEIITLESIRKGINKEALNKIYVEKLLSEGLVEKIGKTSNQKIYLSKAYYSFTNKEAYYTKNIPIDESFMLMKINQYLTIWKKAKMGKFVELFSEQLNREQVKSFIYKLSDEKLKYLEYTGKGSAREYFFGKATIDGGKILEKALKLGIDELKRRGELNIQSTIQSQDFHKNLIKKKEDS